RVAPAKAYAAAAAGLVALAVVSSVQLARWRDTETLFGHALSVRPDSGIAHAAMLVTLTRQGRYDEALAHGRAGTAADPADASLWQWRAVALMDSARRQGPAGRARFDEAADCLREALKVARSNRDGVYASLGAALAQAGRPPEAEAALRDALRLNPANVDAHRNLAVLYRGQGRAEDAVREAEAAAALDPGSPQLAGMVAQLRAERLSRPATRP
ncbi:MAG TPA: tetratricopeptide repeat protein, partial [Humisphaera sp.]